MIKTRDWTPRSAVAAPWFRRGVRPDGTVNELQVPGPEGSAWYRWTENRVETTGEASEPMFPEVTWMSWSGSAVLTPPAMVMPNWAVACGSVATVRQAIATGFVMKSLGAGVVERLMP